MIGLSVGWMDGQAQSECVHPVAFGKGEGWTQGQCQRSTWRVAPSSWPQETVGAPGNPPRRRPARSRRGLPGNDRLAGCVHAERGRCRRNDPPNEVSRDPASVDLGTSKAPKLQSSKAPKLVQFPPVALLGGPERLAQRRETRGSSCLQPVAWRGAARPVEHPLDSPQARASGLDGTPPAALGSERPARSTHPAAKLLVAAGVLAGFDAAPAAASRAGTGVAITAKQDVRAIKEHRR